MNLLMKLKSLILHFDSLSLRKNKITFLKRRVSAFIVLTKVFTHMTSKTVRDTLFARAHD